MFSFKEAGILHDQDSGKAGSVHRLQRLYPRARKGGKRKVGPAIPASGILSAAAQLAEPVYTVPMTLTVHGCRASHPTVTHDCYTNATWVLCQRVVP